MFRLQLQAGLLGADCFIALAGLLQCHGQVEVVVGHVGLHPQDVPQRPDRLIMPAILAVEDGQQGQAARVVRIPDDGLPQQIHRPAEIVPPQRHYRLLKVGELLEGHAGRYTVFCIRFCVFRKGTLLT